MAADESAEEQQPEQSEQMPAISRKGWMIVIGVVVLEAVSFVLILFLSRTDSKQEKSEAAEMGARVDADFLNKYKISLQGLSYSVMTTSANMATLAMKVDILLGMTDEEQNSPGGDVPNQEEMIKFQSAVRALEPDIRDYLQSIIDNMTIQQLLKPEGKDFIKQRVKTYVNDRLERVEFPDVREKWSRRRVTDVMITQFILQR
jgi:flagellar basal body-associated protein FliL